ncbi:MAG: hypothetical protein APF81_17885 [Desulfosporosinus sp. BRH_c37]|nr:MAG: hypothetical protein APF81_17885 [Desulfosporosinus sp. BRH_c37]
MNLKRITFISFILSLVILLFKLSINFLVWLDVWFEYTNSDYVVNFPSVFYSGQIILPILQFLPLIPFLYVFYRRQTQR